MIQRLAKVSKEIITQYILSLLQDQLPTTCEIKLRTRNSYEFAWFCCISIALELLSLYISTFCWIRGSILLIRLRRASSETLPVGSFIISQRFVVNNKPSLSSTTTTWSRVLEVYAYNFCFPTHCTLSPAEFIVGELQLVVVHPLIPGRVNFIHRNTFPILSQSLWFNYPFLTGMF